MDSFGHFHYIVRHCDIDAFSHGKIVAPKEAIRAAIRARTLTLKTCPNECTGVYTEICSHVSSTYMKSNLKCESCGSPKALSFVPLSITADEDGDCYGKSCASDPSCAACGVSKYHTLSRASESPVEQGSI